VTVLGFVDFEQVWLDDRARCRWALRGLDLTLEPGMLVAVVGGADDGGPDAVLDLVAGRRLPDKGRVSLDGIDLRDLDRTVHRRAVVELELQPGGERRLCLPQATMLAARPSPSTLASADLLVVLEDGVEVARGALASAKAG
jgi:ABC-type uncharacterized transport system ATPase component